MNRNLDQQGRRVERSYHSQCARWAVGAVALILALVAPAGLVAASSTSPSRRVTGLTYPVMTVFTPDSQFLAAADKHGVTLRDTRSLRVVHTFGSNRGAGPLVAFSRSGHLMATGSPLGKIVIFDARSHRVVTSLGPIARTYAERVVDESTDAIAEVDALAISPDGSLVAAAQNIGEVFAAKYYTWSSTTVHVWEVRTGRKIAVLRGHATEGHPAKIVSLAFNPRGDILASGGEDATARLWQARTGRLITTLSHNGRTPHGLVFTPDGQRLVTATDDHVRLWDLRTKRSTVRATARSGHEAFESLALDPSGSVVAIGQADNLIRFWSLNSGRVLRTLGTWSQWRLVISVAFSPDGTLLGSVARRLVPTADLELWKLSPR